MRERGEGEKRGDEIGYKQGNSGKGERGSLELRLKEMRGEAKQK